MEKYLKPLLIIVASGITIALAETLIGVNYDGVEFIARLGHRLMLMCVGAFAWNNF